MHVLDTKLFSNYDQEDKKSSNDKKTKTKMVKEETEIRMC